MNKIQNETCPDGLALCPVCNKPATWRISKDAWFTSPMRKVKVRNLDALVHEVCLPTLYADIAAQLKRALLISRAKQVGRATWRFLTNTVLLVWYAALYLLLWLAWPARWIWAKLRPRKVTCREWLSRTFCTPCQMALRGECLGRPDDICPIAQPAPGRRA
jgi:hypothetical protein